MRPTWVEVSRAALRHNFRTIQSLVGPDVAVCAVVKANAYGHGGAECARVLRDEGAEWFGVTSTEGGGALRGGGIGGRILLMSGFWRGEEEQVVGQRLTPMLWEAWHVAALENAAARAGVDRFPIHLKVDTGMSRLGVAARELEQRLAQIGKSPHLELEGVATHFASAEICDAPDFQRQRVAFAAVREVVRAAGFSPRYTHAANTAAMISRPEMRLDMVRAGISLYGYTLPFVGETPPPPEWRLPLRMALSWKSRIIALRELAAGQTVGYGATFTAPRPMRVAVLPVGYADGLNWKLSGCGQMMVGGKLAPVVGRISMDLTTIDVSDVPGAQLGGEVLILGTGGQHSISAVDHARLAGTTVYEILCNINHRVRRQYVD